MDTLRKSRNLCRATSTGRSCHGCRHDIKSAVDRARTTGSTPCHRRDSPARRVLCQHPPFTDGETEAQRSDGLPSQEVTGAALGSGSSPSEFTLSLTDPSCPREPSAPTSLPPSSPAVSRARLPCSVTSHLSEVLFRPDAVALPGCRAGAAAAEGGQENSQAASMLQTVTLRGQPGRVRQPQARFPTARPSVPASAQPTPLSPSRWDGIGLASL